MSLWYSAKERVPKRSDGSNDFSVDVIVLSKGENRIAYYVYDKKLWWYIDLEGTGFRIDVEYWTYIPEFELNELPVIDGE